MSSTNKPSGPVLFTRDPFTEKFNEYAHSATLQRLERKFQPRPYFERYKVLRVLALVASYVFNSFSALTAAALVYFFAVGMIGHPAPAVVLTAAALVLLEATKRATHTVIWKDAIQYRRAAAGLVGAAVLFSGLSIASSYFGAKRLVQEFTPPPAQVDAQEAAAPILEQIAAIDLQISEARATRYKGTTTTTSARTIEALSRQKEPLVQELARIHAMTSTGNLEAMEAHAGTLSIRAEVFAGITLLLELLFVLCAFYLEFYDYRSLAEFATIEAGTPGATTSPTAGTQTTQPAPPAHQPKAKQNGQHDATMSAGRQIGFITGNALRYDARTQGPEDASDDAMTSAQPGIKMRPCEHCGNQYAARTTWQKFCSEGCRKEHHAIKHGGVPYDPARKFGGR